MRSPIRPAQARFSSSGSGSSDSGSDSNHRQARGQSPSQQASPESSDILIASPAFHHDDHVALLNRPGTGTQQTSNMAADSSPPFQPQDAPGSGKALQSPFAASKPVATQPGPSPSLQRQGPSPVQGHQALFRKLGPVAEGSGSLRPAPSLDSSAAVSQAAAGLPEYARQQGSALGSPDASQAMSRSVESVHPSDSNSNGRAQQGSNQRRAWTEQEAVATRRVLQVYGKDWQLLQVMT